MNRRALLHFIQYVLFIPLLLFFCLLWLIHVAIMLPFLILGFVLNRRRRREELRRPVGTRVRFSETSKIQKRTFNRVNDVSKLYGCNVRNVQYRWAIFTDAIASWKPSDDGEAPSALDFGAGSLRDTWELSNLGFQVIAVDYNEDALESFRSVYDWGLVKVPPHISSAPLRSIDRKHGFRLAVAFDVLEHLERVEDAITDLRRLLLPNGLLLVSVPNRRSLYETFWRFNVRYGLHKGRPAGEYHLQFHSPEQWRALFERNGFQVLKHDMTVGFLVNDSFNALYRIPVGLFVEPVFNRLRQRFGVTFLTGDFSLVFCPSWLMELVHNLDVLLRPLFEARWGWNLFVLSPSPSFHVVSYDPAAAERPANVCG